MISSSCCGVRQFAVAITNMLRRGEDEISMWTSTERASPQRWTAKPNVRAEAGPTAKRQARAVENAPARRAGLVF